ncbi:hypothetical protein SAMN04488068_0802 [Hydrocarboniphaga daqingensis]|uniref:Cadherin-like beta sandwich domain-containing protein n=1 Tax=Hydrocarboniphaga daqingensis TaxID=490188 RepID=A0A1M5LB11_9GAMM|nr:hypothetical protein [Hydrocarboniphaga daqingensis]SHG62198.1 hypothetical protein SAMN04488068_0802 [Hydrocarboniphaga daqingensis]
MARRSVVVSLAALLVAVPLPAFAARTVINELQAGQIIDGQLDETDASSLLGVPYDVYHLVGTPPDMVLTVAADSADVDLSVSVKFVNAGWTAGDLLSLGEIGGGNGASGGIELVGPADLLIEVRSANGKKFGAYSLRVEAVDRTDFYRVRAARQALSGDAGDIATIKRPKNMPEPAVVVDAPAAVAYPPFPALAPVPGFPQFEQARALYNELTAPDWKPAIQTVGLGTVIDATGIPVSRINGLAFCEGRKGPVEVRYLPVAGTQRQLTSFRAREADCGGGASGSVDGLYTFSDGSTLIGKVWLRRNDLRVRAIGPVVVWTRDGLIAGTAAADMTVTPLAVWNPASGIVLAALDGGTTASKTAIPGRLIYPGLGAIDGQVQAGRFLPPSEAHFVAEDGTYQTSGLIVESKGAPQDAVRRNPIDGVAADAITWLLTGLTRIETTTTTVLGPAGAYLYHGTLEAGALPAEARPEPATLARHALSAADCTIRPNLPIGWLPWGPNCATTPDRLDAWSIDGRYRLRYVADLPVRLQEIAADRPGHVTSEWRAAEFSADRIPTVVGSGELWRNDQLVYRGVFEGLLPNGEGECSGEMPDTTEPCTFLSGERIDAIHLARMEQKKLDDGRSAATAARIKAEADEKARLQRIAQQEAQRQAEAKAAAQRAAAQRAAELEAQRRAQQQAEAENGFQWGKLAAIATGAVLGGAGSLDSGTQAQLLMGAVQDSMGGVDGMSSTSAAIGSAGGGSGIGSALSPSAAGGGGGGFATRSNTLIGSTACAGYSNDNYKEFFASNSDGPDVQLHTMCAAAFNYYAMYLNAIKQGYSEAQCNQTYGAFQQAASVATNFYESTRTR